MKARQLLLLSIMLLAACTTAPTATPQPEIESTSAPEVTEAATEEVAAATEESAPTPRPTLAPDEWMTLPIVPEVTDTAREIYARGLELGRDPTHFSKIGDCQTNTGFYLVDFDHDGWYSLGEDYAYLQDTIDYYQGSYSRTSLAMRDGYNVAAVLTPLRADPKQCEKGENPIQCEFRLHNPSIAIISLETNFNDRPADDYGKYMRQIIEYSIEQGVVPILATKGDNVEGDNSINAEIAKIAVEYDIPLWNLWAALQPLPNQGHDTELNDGFHLSFARNFFDQPKNMLSGWPWRNLTALQALDSVRRGLEE
ncbi:MAG TPA: SGNH/GDSL hydrolase family protein [Anaerolineales bacterium]|nr:SGNH/GDSL hydrolase family protein [Anaerolineales bacterium]